MNYQFQPTCQIPPETLDRIYTDAFGVKKNGTFVEVGAHDGWHWSCTWGLAEIGWRGIYVEPVKALFEACKDTNRNRPNISVMNCCIGAENGKAILGMCEYGASIESVDKTFEIKQMTLDSLLTVHSFPRGFDLLLIDVEGGEVGVLAGFNCSEWLPKLVIIERPPEPNQMTKLGYEKIYSDWINTVYRRS